MTQLTAIINGHREGVIAGVTARNALAAIALAEQQGIKTELLVILDRADDLTKEALRTGLGNRAIYHETEFGDVGNARAFGTQQAKGEFCTFLDGDDLWSLNWLTEGYAAARKRPDAIHHSHCNVVFGMERNLWWHMDSEGPFYEPDYMSWQNYWDSLSFVATDIHRRYPYCPSDSQSGFAYEDWHWNIITLKHGIAHKPVPGTIHFKRRRRGSLMSVMARNDGVAKPD